MEVAMPSGFLVDKDRLTELLRKPHIKLTELKSGETIVDVYIDQMLPNEDLCLEVQGYRSHKVAENKPVPVRIYDYYDSCKCLIIVSHNWLNQLEISFVIFVHLLQLEVLVHFMKFHSSHHVKSVKAMNAPNHARNKRIVRICHSKMHFLFNMKIK